MSADRRARLGDRPHLQRAREPRAAGRAVRAELDRVAPDHAILVVDDSSPDGTGELADRLAHGRPAVRSCTARGRWGSARPTWRDSGARWRRGGTGARDGRGLLARPAYLPALIDAAAEADLVLGSRYVAGGGIRNWGRLRRLVSQGGCWYARTVLGVTVRDLTGGFKCFRREVLEAIDLSRPLAGLRLPGRAHVPRAAAGVPRHGDPDRVHGPARGTEQDVPPDRAGGDVDDPRLRARPCPNAMLQVMK